MLPALAGGEIDEKYIKVVKEANKNYWIHTMLFANPVRIPIEKGVRQDDPL